MRKGKCTECGEIKPFMFASDVCSDCIEKSQTRTCGMNKLPWTKELPQESGYYWRCGPPDWTPEPIEIMESSLDFKACVLTFGAEETECLEKIDGEVYWLPMEVPDPPEI